MTTTTYSRYSHFAWLILAACGGSKPAQPSADSLKAGGETSEFGGETVYCQPLSTTARDLDDDDVAPWVAMAEGRYELGFGWQRRFLTDAIGGFEEHTRVVLDVSVLEAYDVELEPLCPGGNRSLHLELEVALATADGALQGTFRHRVGTAPAPARELGEPLSTVLVLPVVPTSLDDFSGSLEYGVDLELQARREFSARLAFDGGSVLGKVSTFLSPGTGEDQAAGWTPLEGVFPDDGCAFWAARPIDVDAPLNGFAEATPRALIERALSLWEQGPIAAERSPGRETSVQLSAAGEPVACEGVDQLSAGTVGIDVPVRIETADASLAIEHTVHFTFGPESAPIDVRTWPRLWIPVDEFEQVTGIQGVGFGSGEFGSVDFHSSFDFDAGTTSGLLSVEKWQGVDSQSTGFVLTW